MYLLDTNVCIDFALRRGAMLATNMRRAYVSGIAISAITLAELKVGGKQPDHDPDNDRRLDMLVATLALLPFDEAAALAYGRLVREVGVRRRNFDRLIAAHALASARTLVTSNKADFADVPGLRVENWSVET